MLRVFLIGTLPTGATVRATVEGSTPAEVASRVALFVVLNPACAWEEVPR